MRLANRQLLNDFMVLHADAKPHLQTWRSVIKDAVWLSPYDVKGTFTKASIIGGKNVIFDIYRNNYRIWTKVDYLRGVVMIKEIGNHKEYDKWEIK